jgi:hypothetical protein
MGQAVEKLAGPRMSPLGATPPTVVERFIAEWQLGDPLSPADAWQPWKRRNVSERKF